MVLPMSFSLSQSPPSILHFLHAAETTATSSPGSRGTAMDSDPAMALGLGLKSKPVQGEQSTRLKLAIAQDLQFLPICHPELRRWETGPKLVFCPGPEWVRTGCLLVMMANHVPACVRAPSSVWQERTDRTDCLPFKYFTIKLKG